MRPRLTLGLPLGLVLFLCVCANVRAAGADTIQLAWDPSADTVMGYVVYVGSQPGAYAVAYDVGNTLAFTLPNAVPGQPYYFAVASYTPGPVIGALSPEVTGYSDMPPTLVNPGGQVSDQGQTVSLQLVGADPAGQPVSFSATGLPPGIQIASSGMISGAATTAGSYPVTATVSDGRLTASATFTWTVRAVTVLPPPPPPDTTAPQIAITSPTASGSYTAAASPLTIAGTASDNVGVTSVAWAIERGGGAPEGTAEGTSDWRATVPLSNGQNRVTITARDGAGNIASTTISVQYKAAGGGNGKP